MTMSGTFPRLPVLASVAAAVALFALAETTPLIAQEPVEITARARAEQTLPPDVFRGVTALADEVSASGVPAEPLFSKALEGMAKRVPPDRLLPAVRAYAGRLGESRMALGDQASIPLVVAGADAIQRGVPREALESLPRDRPRSPVAVLVLAELMESGVPADRAIAVLRQSMDQRIQDRRMLEITARVRRLIRDGVPPHEAIDRVRRAMRRDRRIGPLPTGDQVISDRRLRRRGG